MYPSKFFDAQNDIIKEGYTVAFKPSTKFFSIMRRGKVVETTKYSIKIRYRNRFGNIRYTNIYNTQNNVLIIRR